MMHNAYLFLFYLESSDIFAFFWHLQIQKLLESTYKFCGLNVNEPQVLSLNTLYLYTSYMCSFYHCMPATNHTAFVPWTVGLYFSEHPGMSEEDMYSVLVIHMYGDRGEAVCMFLCHCSTMGTHWYSCLWAYCRGGTIPVSSHC